MGSLRHGGGWGQWRRGLERDGWGGAEASRVARG